MSRHPIPHPTPPDLAASTGDGSKPSTGAYVGPPSMAPPNGGGPAAGATPAFVWANTLVDQWFAEMKRWAAAGLAAAKAAVGGTVLCGAPQDAAPPPSEVRVRGWLRHVWRKATTPDDWSATGTPHEWWDKMTGPPMTSFPRFDLQEIAYPIALLANRTPAWREVYGEILHRCAERYTTHWSAVDWLNQIDNDPDQMRYPRHWKGSLIPAAVFGKGYNTPGWTGNGLGKNGIEADPIEADGMLFFKGWMALVLTLADKVSGETRWDTPWPMAGVGGSSKDWTLSSLCARLHDQWSQYEHGLH
mmetsp:Transcript_8237/g.24438  ORF Transcript_8237/g.24438 Transcript_8237/m.24438 type:complete len:302 (+) Transcript_8237:90-995(+)